MKYIVGFFLLVLGIIGVLLMLNEPDTGYKFNRIALSLVLSSSGVLFLLSKDPEVLHHKTEKKLTSKK